MAKGRGDTLAFRSMSTRLYPLCLAIALTAVVAFGCGGSTPPATVAATPAPSEDAGATCANAGGAGCGASPAPQVVAVAPAPPPDAGPPPPEFPPPPQQEVVSVPPLNAKAPALERMYSESKHSPAKARLALQAAFERWKTTRAGEPARQVWLKNTVSAWEFLNQTPDGKSDAAKSPFSDWAAEAEFTLVDDELKKSFDYDAGHLRLAGTVEEIMGKVGPAKGTNVKGKYAAAAADADRYDLALSRIIKTYPSPRWVIASFARAGSVFDSLRTALYELAPPALAFFTPKQEEMLQKLEKSGRDELAAKADDLRKTVKEAYRTKKEHELDGADTLVIRDYATALVLAKYYGVAGDPVVEKARSRIQTLVPLIGDAKVKAIVEATVDPRDPQKQKKLVYQDGMFN